MLKAIIVYSLSIERKVSSFKSLVGCDAGQMQRREEANPFHVRVGLLYESQVVSHYSAISKYKQHTRRVTRKPSYSLSHTHTHTKGGEKTGRLRFPWHSIHLRRDDTRQLLSSLVSLMASSSTSPFLTFLSLAVWVTLDDLLLSIRVYTWPYSYPIGLYLLVMYNNL